MRALPILLGLGFVLSPSAHGASKKKKEKSETTIEVFKRDRSAEEEEDAKLSGPAGPRLSARDVVRIYQTKAQAKRDEAIRVLKEIIRDTPDDDAQKPDYFFRLSELYWGKANFYTLRGFGYDDEIWKTEKTAPARHEQLKRLKRGDLERSKQYRRDTLKVYQAIRQRFPDYKKMDEVLFYMGFNYKEMNDDQEAQKAFVELIKKHPQSRFVPDAWLAFGEFFFDIDEMAKARKAYDKAARFKEPKTYGFAVYKRGWCNYNVGDHRKAMEDFLEVIRYSREEGKGERSRISLINEASKDLVTVYAQVGTGAKAIDFFQKVAPKRWPQMAFRLAKLYSGAGKVRDANELYRRLIRLNKDKPDIIDYEFAITRNIESLGHKGTTTKEVGRLVGLFVKLRSEGKLVGKKRDDSAKRVRELLKDLGTNWHREAQVTKNDSYLTFAHTMYRYYVETFPDADDVYVMTFYLAELLYRIEKWEEAAAAYDRVIALDKKGRFAKDAAHAAVLAYQKLLNLSEREEKRGTEKASEGTPEAKELEPEAKRFLKACDTYSRMVSDGDRIVDVKYYAALLYYDNNQFDEAIKRFEDIIKTHPGHRLAYYSANLVLDSHNLKGDYLGLNAAVERFVEVPAIARGKLLEDLQTLQEGARFKKCMALEAEGKHEVAAAAFAEFARSFPASEFFDKALYNCALNYERVNQIEKAIACRVGLLRERPDSDLAPKALYAIAGNLHASAVYSQAARYYERFANQYPKDEKAKQALANAAMFRRGLGQYDQAIKDSEQWVQRYGREKPKEAAEVFFSIGEIHEARKKTRKAVEQYENFLKLKRYAQVASDDRKIVAHTRIGLLRLQQKRTRAASAAFTQAVKVYGDLDEARTKALVDGREAAAHARFMQGEALFARFKSQPVDNANAKTLAKQVGEKLKRLEAAKAVYDSVIPYGHPNWAIAAIGRNGAGFQELAAAVRNAPPPKGLNEEEVMVYQDALDQQAEQFDQRAADNYVLVLKLAVESSWFNEWSTRAEAELQKLRPEEYPLAGELRPEAGFASEPRPFQGLEVAQ